MNKVQSALVTLLILGCASLSPAKADVYTFASNDGSGTPNDMMDLEHAKYYGWSIADTKASTLATQLTNGYYISSAKLTFDNIYNWQYETNDQLSSFLLSGNPPMPGKGTYTVGLYNSDGTPKETTTYTYEYTQTNLRTKLTGADCTKQTNNKYTCVKIITTNTPKTTSSYKLRSEVKMQNTVTYTAAGQILSDNLWQMVDQQSLDTVNWGVESTRIAEPWHDPIGGAYVKDSTGKPTSTLRNFDLVYNFDQTLIDRLTAYAGDGSFGFGIDPDCHYYNNGITFTVETSLIPVPPEEYPVPEPSTILLLGAGLLGAGLFARKRNG